jgi:hypothetical protein
MTSSEILFGFTVDARWRGGVAKAECVEVIGDGSIPSLPYWQLSKVHASDRQGFDFRARGEEDWGVRTSRMR